jgi:hypothetical protein
MQDNIMDASENNNDISSTKTHEEIIQMIEEIKQIENNYPEFDITEEEQPEELIEVEEEIIEEFPPVDKELDKTGFKKWLDQKKENKPDSKPATFKIRFDDSGELVNLDFRKPKVKPEVKKKKAVKFNFKKLKGKFKRKGKKTEEESEGSGEKTEKPDESEEKIEKPKRKKEKSSKFSGLKSKLGGISKLKRVIPSKKKKDEEKEEVKEEEEESE